MISILLYVARVIHPYSECRLDPYTDKIRRVNFNNQSRDSVLTLTSDVVKKVYKGLKLFSDLAYSDENIFMHKMAEGK